MTIMIQFFILLIILIGWIIVNLVLENKKKKTIFKILEFSNCAITKVKKLDVKLDVKLKNTIDKIKPAAKKDSKDLSQMIKMSEAMVYTSQPVSTFYDPFQEKVFTTLGRKNFLAIGSAIDKDDFQAIVAKNTKSKELETGKDEAQNYKRKNNLLKFRAA